MPMDADDLKWFMDQETARREWLAAELGKLSDRVEVNRTEAQKAQAAAFTEHKREYHNPAKTWGILSAVATVALGFWELVKRLFAREG